MKERVEDFSHIPVGESILVISYGGEPIESFMLPSINFEDQHVDTITEDYFDFNFESIDYEIDVFASSAGVQITISSEYNDNALNDFEIDIEEIPPEAEEVKKVIYYVPTAPFTKTLSSALFELANSETIIPMIDIENENKFHDYLDDDLIDFKHYLDISSLKYVVNADEREQIKEIRKREKKEIGRMQTPLPSTVEEVLPLNEKIDKFKEIQDKTKVTPVYLWDENANKTDLETFVNELSHYQDFSIRVLDKHTFLDEVDEIKSLYENFTIFMDLNTNYNTSNIKYYLKKFDEHFDNIIYLGAHFISSQMSVSQDQLNTNVIFNNNPIDVYHELLNDYPRLKYGDYCGFDRKTLSSLPKGGRPSARVVLQDLNQSKKMLIRRGWDDKDKTVSADSGQIKLGVINSMHKLLCDIQQGKLDMHPSTYGNIFMDENICDADEALKAYCPERTTPGEVKTLCIRHNIRAVQYNYME